MLRTGTERQTRPKSFPRGTGYTALGVSMRGPDRVTLGQGLEELAEVLL